VLTVVDCPSRYVMSLTPVSTASPACLFRYVTIFTACLRGHEGGTNCFVCVCIASTSSVRMMHTHSLRSRLATGEKAV
jgi:hypothetical protein